MGRQTVVWTIAGFDPSSGAGITADLMTFAAHGLFGCSAITALTVQSTQGVLAAEATRPELLSEMLSHLYADLPPEGIKIGMLGTEANMIAVADFLRWMQQDRSIPIVLDPVLRSSSGRDLFPASAVQALGTELLPLVDYVTPNWVELALLADSQLASVQDAEAAARKLMLKHPKLGVVATGGDQVCPVDLLMLPSADRIEFIGTHIHSRATHGTGCAYSSALLSRLVLGDKPQDACRAAKLFVERAIRRAPGLGKGKGPLDLLWPFHADDSRLE